MVPLGLSLGLADLGSGDMNVGGGGPGTTVQCPEEETGLRGGQGTYQLVDAVNGPVVLVTEPLHAFKAEKSKGKALVTAQNRPPGGDGTWTGSMGSGGASLPPRERAETIGLHGAPHTGTRLGQEFRAEVVMARRLHRVLTHQS